MKKTLTCLFALVCLFALCACTLEGNLSSPTKPTQTEAAPSTDVPVQEPENIPEVPTQEPTQEPVQEPTQEPTQEIPTVEPKETQSLSDKETEQLETLLSIVGKGVLPGEKFTKAPTSEQANSALCTYINTMTNSQLQKAGVLKDDMLMLTQEQWNDLYEDLFNEGEAVFKEDALFGFVMKEDKLCVPMASGENMLIDINEIKANTTDDDDVTYTVYATLTQEFDETARCACEVVVEKDEESAFGFVVRSFFRGELAIVD